MSVLSSPKNARVIEAAKLALAKERRARQEMLLEGPHLLSAAVDAGVTVSVVFGLESDDIGRELAARAGADWVPCTERVIERIGSTSTPQSPVAVASIPGSGRQTGRDLLVAYVTDPGNAGTLIRTGAALGFDLAFPAGAVDVWSPKVLRAGAGAHFSTTISTGESLDPSIGTIATVVRGGLPLHDLGTLLDASRRWAILIGEEAAGLERRHVETADLVVTIPMAGSVESLNAAVAGAIVAYEVGHWRNSVGALEAGH